MPLIRRVNRLQKELQLRWIKESRDIGEWSLQRAYYADEGEYRYDAEKETAAPGRRCFWKRQSKYRRIGWTKKPELYSRLEERDCCPLTDRLITDSTRTEALSLCPRRLRQAVS